MRKYLTQKLKDGYFLHADMWGTRFPFPEESNIKVIDFGLAETTLVNAAAGLYLNGENVYIYGVAGYIIHQMEQIKYTIQKSIKDIPTKGKIIIFNAGKIGYDKMSEAHRLVDDCHLMRHYNILYFDPIEIEDLENALKIIDNENVKLSYIRLGKDF